MSTGLLAGAVPGRPLVKLVRLNAIMGSLETIGTLERTASAYIRSFHLLKVQGVFTCFLFCIVLRAIPSPMSANVVHYQYICTIFDLIR